MGGHKREICFALTSHTLTLLIVCVLETLLGFVWIEMARYLKFRLGVWAWAIMQNTSAAYSIETDSTTCAFEGQWLFKTNVVVFDLQSVILIFTQKSFMCLIASSSNTFWLSTLLQVEILIRDNTSKQHWLNNCQFKAYIWMACLMTTASCAEIMCSFLA